MGALQGRLPSQYVEPVSRFTLDDHQVADYYVPPLPRLVLLGEKLVLAKARSQYPLYSGCNQSRTALL